IVSASGSANSRAASAEASTTLTQVTVGPYDGGRACRRAQAKPANFREQLGGAQVPLGPDRFLDDGEQLALRRPMVPLRSLPQASDDLVGGIFDREIDRHGSEPAPIRNLDTTQQPMARTG